MKAIDIRKRRKELGLSQTELGEMIGVSLGTIYNYEKGDVIPSSSYQMLNKVLFNTSEKSDEKKSKVESLRAEVYEATNNLINTLNQQIKEVQQEPVTIASIEKTQSLLRIKLELIKELQQSIS